MNAQIFCLMALISADPASPFPISQDASAPYRASTLSAVESAPARPLFIGGNWRAGAIWQPTDSVIVRGQTPTYSDPTYDESLPSYDPGEGTSTYGAETAPAPYAPWNPLAPAPAPVDPFQAPAIIPGPYGGYGGVCGVLGPQPYRLGWTTRADVGYLPSEPITGTGAAGELGIFEVNTELRYTSPLPDGWMMSLAPQFNYRSWDGPSGPGLPGSVYRIGGDIELSTPAAPLSLQVAFNPSVNTDFEHSATSDAWNFDARGAVFLRTSPQWMWVLGAAYWDRVEDHVIPYAGVVWNPIDIWEWRLVFPNPRVSLFLGNAWGVGHWLYVTGEYHIESYEIHEATFGRREQIEIEDWRALIGLRTESGGVSGFVEAGWVFDRDAEFRYGTPGFDIDSGFIARLGLRY